MKELTKANLKLARRIWAIQKRNRLIKFIAKDFTRRGKLSKYGLLKIKKR